MNTIQYNTIQKSNNHEYNTLADEWRCPVGASASWARLQFQGEQTAKHISKHTPSQYIAKHTAKYTANKWQIQQQRTHCKTM